jgi:hypothetical protein
MPRQPYTLAGLFTFSMGCRGPADVSILLHGNASWHIFNQISFVRRQSLTPENLAFQMVFFFDTALGIDQSKRKKERKKEKQLQHLCSEDAVPSKSVRRPYTLAPTSSQPKRSLCVWDWQPRSFCCGNVFARKRLLRPAEI